MLKEKMKTPDWILEGYDSKTDWERQKNKFSTSSKQSKDSSTKAKNKTFKIRKCPKCDSEDVKVVIGENGIWKCRKCGWEGEDIKQKKLTEDEFIKLMEEKGEEVS